MRVEADWLAWVRWRSSARATMAGPVLAQGLYDYVCFFPPSFFCASSNRLTTTSHFVVCGLEARQLPSTRKADESTGRSAPESNLPGTAAARRA